MMRLLIYLPAYNEELNIVNVINNLPKNISSVKSIDYLVVNDGSIDKTSELAQSSGAQVITHSRNKGVGAAFHSAVKFALEKGADILVGIDADGQFDPDEIQTIIKPIIADTTDMVIGNRFTDGKPKYMSYIKYWGNIMVASLVSYIGGQKFQDVSCGFRSYSREALLNLNVFSTFTYTHETILSLAFQGLRVKDLAISIKYYPERKSRVAKSILHYAMQTSKIILRMLLDYSPIRVFGALGSALFFIGTGFELFLLGHYAIASSFSPYKTAGFIGLGFIILGVLVLLLALIADMLNRIRINQDKQIYELKKARYEK